MPRVKKQKEINPETATAEEIEKFNKEAKERMDALKAEQARNRSKKAKPVERDPNVIRGIEGKDRIECICLRRVGLNDLETADVGEKVLIPKSVAKELQKNRVIEVYL